MSELDVDRLLAENLPRLRGFVRLRAGAMVRAMEGDSDIVQSVCREVLEHRERFRHGGEEGFRRWLYTSVMRKLGHRADYYRAQKRDQARVRAFDDEAAGQVLEGYRGIATPSGVLRQREELERIEAAFDALPEHYREVITLARIAELPQAEIAAQTGRSEGSVRMLLYRGLERLSELLERPAPPQP